MQRLRHERCDDRGDFDAGAGIEQQRAGAPGQDILQGPGHLVANGPHHFAFSVGQMRVQAFVPVGLLGEKRGYGGCIGALGRQVAEGVRVVVPAV